MEGTRIKRASFYELVRSFEKSLGYKNDIKWTSFIAITLYHILGVYWCYHYAFPVKWPTLVFAAIMYVASGFGITGGAHRYWTHKAYKAKLPLKLFLMVCFASAGQNSIKQWVRDHRIHHKFSDTEADPHNANRGLFFSHIGWLMMKKNDEVLQAGKQIDMSDIENDVHLQIFEKYFNYIKLVFCYILPTTIGIWLWGEDWRCSVAWQCFIRFLTMFHSELTVNSLAHAYGYKPYNRNIIPAENRFVATCTLGEGWHNYHHAFPFDYKAAEHFDFLNFGTWFIQFFEKIGWAYDLRQATPGMINSIAKRLGDGTPVHFPTSECVE
ncbi:acyl-CoA Delta-9 desaturase isoform X1 [Amyelois transitella]|uniref:acyl-CoA Delta-9 desaturase isoform X1 n=2 Tax=Amyelois transitella TaxID=680683 RepID=UPI00067BBF3B|nr:acyl-CoA Delta-9 desaturase isoform X1 [Amyelois transitella]